ncbi:MAG TPA: PQQ-binding-like beta-propeller repeat protein [Pirellulales bacterium]|nr:PQQ-binding-like beta-propeller repeat protein [Pirellulales bacterium]
MKALIALVLVASTTAVGRGADDALVWPRFRGPNGSGVAEGQKPPVEFGPDKNVKWKIAVPPGISSPIVAGDSLIITAFEDGKLYTIAYRRADGKEAWRAEAPAESIEGYHKIEGSPAASTSATDGRSIVSYFGSCGLFCYDLSGKELWRMEMPTVATGADFGTGVSPIIVDGIVILVRDELKDPKIIAVDLATGTLKWEQPRLSRASWCTPVVWDTPEGKQVVAAGHAQMIGYDLMSGAERWNVVGLPSGCCPSPVTAGGNLLFAGSSSGEAEERGPERPSYDSLLKDLDKDQDGAISKDEGEAAFRGFFDNQDANKDGKVSREEFDAIAKFMSEGKNTAFALQPGGTGDLTSQTIWKRAKGLPYIASAIAYGGQYIMVKDGGIVIGCDAETGKQLYQERAGASGRYYASPVAANDHVYLTSLENGDMTVLRVGAGKPALASKAELGERCAATPAIADDALYVRTAEHLWAFAEK